MKLQKTISVANLGEHYAAGLRLAKLAVSGSADIAIKHCLSDGRKMAAMVSCALCLSSLAAAAGQKEIIFDNVEGIAVDQPRVAVEVYDQNPRYTYGPEIYNFWLLDTGAQGILAAGPATGEMKEAGYQTVNQFMELGIGGEVYYDVSEVYQFDFAGSDGQRRNLADVRILSSDTADFGSFGGIAGMPALVNRTTSLDMTAMVDSNNPMPYMNVAFSQEPLTGNGDYHRYTAPITLLDYPAAKGQVNPGDALPTYAPLPFIELNARHQSNFAAEQSFILDTGAQITILDAALAYDKLGLKEEDALDYIELGGVGEEGILAPVLAVDELRLPTEQDIDIVFKNLQLIVLNLDEALAIDEESEIYGKINGVFGSDMLTAGYFQGVLDSLLDGNGEKGFFDAVHFDFTDSASFNGIFALDINSQYHVIIPEPSSFLILMAAAAAVAVFHRGSRNTKSRG